LAKLRLLQKKLINCAFTKTIKMKNFFIVILAVSLLSSCGKGKGGKELGEEVCNCSKKANAMPSSDPGRAKAQTDCSIKQVEAWDKIKNNQKESDAFNKVLGVCATEQIEKSFGK
jgi:hypothetical protein